MEMNAYQKQAQTFTAGMVAGGDDQAALVYLSLGLNGEAGEVADKVKKILRDSGGEVTPEVRESIILELGDTLWYVGQLARWFGTDLQEVAEKNIAKLEQRRRDGRLHGSGDVR